MKIIILIFNLIWLLTQQALSNNVQVSNVRLTGQDTAGNFTMVEFDISWENSWRYSGGPANWDAAWVFVKYRVGTGGDWNHVWLNNTGHITCGNAMITNGFLSPELPYNSSTNPSLGVFLYRSAAGTGTFSCQDVQLRWNYSSNSVSDNAQVDIRVFAIEMVHIPQGSFYVGAGGSERGKFYTYPDTLVPYHITSEAAITVGNSTGNLYYASGYSAGDQGGPIPAPFPKGFKAFYAMKYEISQQAYAEFLNTLTRQQQQRRVSSNISGTSVASRYVMSNSTGPINRSYIKCFATLPPPPGRVYFYCDYNNNEIGGEEGDGQNVACNYLSFNDVGAYLDWSALRPMSEFEFEKSGRGSQFPSPNEFAWGNSDAYLHTGLNNFSLSTEIPIGPTSNIASSASNGPLRVGSFARTYSDRTISGAGYYGCMDISSNLYERGIISVGHPDGRIYEGKHGNGKLNVEGEYDVNTWPNAVAGNAPGSGFRGGSWNNEIIRSRLSDRQDAAYSDYNRYAVTGGRGVRTVQ